MAKKYTWTIEETLENEEKATHSVVLVCSTITGKAIITIDGDEFDISVKPFSLRGTSQAFRLGEEAAAIEFPQKGAPILTVSGEKISCD